MTPFEIIYSPEAAGQRRALQSNPGQAHTWKAVRKTLAMMETNLRRPSLKTHKYLGARGPQGQEVFEAYAQNRTPGAYRVIWCYGPSRNQLWIIAITPHP